MAFKKYTSKQDVSAVDIHDVAKMTEEEYQDYLRDDVFQIDHHEVLRSAAAGYAFAVTARQLRLLIAFLQTMEGKVGGGIIKE